MSVRAMQTGGVALGLLVAIALVLSIGQAGARTPPANAFGFSWQEAGSRDHPLVGRIWSAADGSFLDPASLTATLARADFLLLGEVHDNADAHGLQGWAIGRRVEAQSKFGVVFEHIRTDQQEALAKLDEFDRTARRVATANDLFRFLDWQNGGWPSETKFVGLFNAVFNPRLPIYAANPPRQQVRAVARSEEGALSPQERTRILLDATWDKPLADALYNELKGSHCGAIPESAVPAMSVAQRYRDAAFADVMLTAAKDHGAAILIAGNGHVRTDRAVPWYLRERAPGKNIIAVMMLEVEDGQADPAAYAPRAPDGKPAVDFVIFTPRAERPDPCEALRQRSQPKQ
ncbi:MAG: ChaN family lipoprotein [Hyphomicrobiaceae bacterium]